MCNILKGGVYRIKTDGDYFKKKYGEKNPQITIEDTDKNVFGDKWQNKKNTPAVITFMIRIMTNNLIKFEKETAYYGKIKIGLVGLGELVFKHELEKIK
tara:strand:- start:548 stop:844 length:297 start_codon:yes stop_codon:yes gene_type:complete